MAWPFACFLTDVEPVDERKKTLVSCQLLPLIHEQILSIARKRKTEPLKITCTLARRCKQECILAVSIDSMWLFLASVVK